ncbi:MAG: metallophosphoesterase family protein [archaeon]|nr:metallophosphoesterase family protein [archaeon]
MRGVNLTFIFVFSIALMSINGQAAEPEQVHLATTGIPGEMVVQWGTEEDTTLSCSSESIVEYGTENDKLNLSKIGNNNMYLWTTCTHTAILSDLVQNTTYYYRVGGEGEWSGTYSFKTLEENPAKVIIGAIADHGTSSNAQETTNHMENEDMDLVIHAGDISYANGAGSGNGIGDQSVWDEYQNQIENVASRTPHMYAPGNHEEDAEPYGFDAYESRFFNPGSNSFWYSFDFEFIHFISISAEHDYEPGSSQYSWLLNDLEDANENRENVPWIVIFAHRPMYSSNGDGDGHGSDIEFREAMEILLYDFQVDLAVWGHDHHYERTYPVFEEKVYSNKSGSASDPFYKPGATIHIVAGMSGRSAYDGLEDPQPLWSAHREVEYGYTVFEATKTTINYKFIRNSDNQVGDEFWIINSINVQISNEDPSTNYNQTNQTEETGIINQIKELNYLEAPMTIIIIALTAIFNLNYRKK